MTNNELFSTIETSDLISKEVTDILLELDVTNSVTTQASLEELLKKLYHRLADENIEIEIIGKNVSQEDFAKWVDENFDAYSQKLFHEDM